MRPPDLLLLILDTARADAFRQWGGPVPTPAVERVCREGLWCPTAVAAAPWTLPSTASMLTGRLPTEHGVSADALHWTNRRPSAPAPAVRSYVGSWLPEELQGRGYRTFAASCNPWITRWGGFDRGFDELVGIKPWRGLPRGRVGWMARRASQVLARDHGGRRAVEVTERWLGDGDDRRPRFAMVNLMEVHEPYDPPLRYHPSVFGGPTLGASRLRLPYIQFRQRGRLRLEPQPGFVAATRSLYWACARYEDALVGRLLRAFARPGRRTAVVLLSDHGENLGEHGLFNHHTSLHETLLRVPLALWGQGVDVGAGEVSGLVSLLGLPRWMLGLADGDYEPPNPDESVVSEYESTVRHMMIPPDLRRLAARRGEAALPWLARHAGVAVRRGDLKYLASETGLESLYDLRSDPGEEHDVLERRLEDAAWFRPLRDAWLARRAARVHSGEDQGEPAIRDGGDGGSLPPTGDDEEEMAEHLRMLGYIE